MTAKSSSPRITEVLSTCHQLIIEHFESLDLWQAKDAFLEDLSRRASQHDKPVWGQFAPQILNQCRQSIGTDVSRTMSVNVAKVALSDRSRDNSTLVSEKLSQIQLNEHHSITPWEAHRYLQVLLDNIAVLETATRKTSTVSEKTLPALTAGSPIADDISHETESEAASFGDDIVSPKGSEAAPIGDDIVAPEAKSLEVNLPEIGSILEGSNYKNHIPELSCSAFLAGNEPIGEYMQNEDIDVTLAGENSLFPISSRGLLLTTRSARAFTEWSEVPSSCPTESRAKNDHTKPNQHVAMRNFAHVSATDFSQEGNAVDKRAQEGFADEIVSKIHPLLNFERSTGTSDIGTSAIQIGQNSFELQSETGERAANLAQKSDSSITQITASLLVGGQPKRGKDNPSNLSFQTQTRQDVPTHEGTAIATAKSQAGCREMTLIHKLHEASYEIAAKQTKWPVQLHEEKSLRSPPPMTPGADNSCESMSQSRVHLLKRMQRLERRLTTPNTTPVSSPSISTEDEHSNGSLASSAPSAVSRKRGGSGQAPASDKKRRTRTSNSARKEKGKAKKSFQTGSDTDFLAKFSANLDDVLSVIDYDEA